MNYKYVVFQDLGYESDFWQFDDLKAAKARFDKESIGSGFNRVWLAQILESSGDPQERKFDLVLRLEPHKKELGP